MLSVARRPLSAAIPAGNLLGIHLFQCPDTVGIVAWLSSSPTTSPFSTPADPLLHLPLFPSFSFVLSNNKGGDGHCCSEFTYNPMLRTRFIRKVGQLSCVPVGPEEKLACTLAVPFPERRIRDGREVPFPESHTWGRCILFFATERVAG